MCINLSPLSDVLEYTFAHINVLGFCYSYNNYMGSQSNRGSGHLNQEHTMQLLVTFGTCPSWNFVTTLRGEAFQPGHTAIWIFEAVTWTARSLGILPLSFDYPLQAPGSHLSLTAKLP